FFSSRRRHTRSDRDWSSDVCSSDLLSIMPKLLLPPKVWFHGSQSTSTCGRSSRKGQTTAYCSWLTVSMRCVLITPLGVPVEPEEIGRASCRERGYGGGRAG